MTDEDLRLLIGQHEGLLWPVPMAAGFIDLIRQLCREADWAIDDAYDIFDGYDLSGWA